MSLEVGSVVKGKVTGVMKFGAFVALPENKSGMVHISEISHEFVNDINDVIKVGSPGNFQWEKSKDDSGSFEDMMNKFKRTSEDKISDLKRGNESRGYSRRGNRNK